MLLFGTLWHLRARATVYIPTLNYQNINKTKVHLSYVNTNILVSFLTDTKIKNNLGNNHNFANFFIWLHNTKKYLEIKKSQKNPNLS